jgi:hypothetical protein
MTGSANLIVLGTVSEMEHLQTKNGKLWIKLLVEVKTWRRGGDGEAGLVLMVFWRLSCALGAGVLLGR